MRPPVSRELPTSQQIKTPGKCSVNQNDSEMVSSGQAPRVRFQLGCHPTAQRAQYPLIKAYTFNPTRYPTIIYGILLHEGILESLGASGTLEFGFS